MLVGLGVLLRMRGRGVCVLGRGCCFECGEGCSRLSEAHADKETTIVCDGDGIAIIHRMKCCELAELHAL